MNHTSYMALGNVVCSTETRCESNRIAHFAWQREEA